MNKNYNNKVKQTVIECYNNGESVSSLVEELGIPRSTVYLWIKQDTESSSNKKGVSVKNFRALENKVVRLEGIIEILKRVDCTVNDPLEVKLPALEALYGQYSVHMLCDALEVPRGTFYNYVFRSKRGNTWYSELREELRIRIQQIYDESNQIFGSAKILAILQEEVYKKMVRELMRDMGLISIRQDAKDIYDKEKRKYKNYLNQQFTTTRPNEVWVGDVTQFSCKYKNYYICAVLDLYSRRVIGYKIGTSNSTNLVKSAFRKAYEERKPELPLTFHTDRGSNYRSKTFCSYLASLNVTQSFSKAHVPYDNSVMESFFSNLKREELYRTKYRSENEFRMSVDKHMVFYNEKRPHAENGYKTPARKEQDYLNNHASLKDNSK